MGRILQTYQLAKYRNYQNLSRFLFKVNFIVFVDMGYPSFSACVHITENGLQQFNDEECLAPLNDKLNIRDCCSLKPPVLPILTDFIKIKSPQSLILSETRNITKGNAIMIYLNFPVVKKCLCRAGSNMRMISFFIANKR